MVPNQPGFFVDPDVGKSQVTQDDDAVDKKHGNKPPHMLAT